ncbi:hypothetical protein H5397_12005 [Propioniciclava sp. MC1683]|uniref:hypothetical protein n=1 Tax=Propioniciclava sp. MC1683 TaxID=2760309 RepID=UPI0016018D67|nr:hypothetical protein [Propioniciclava sp. MC1683]MBB1502140.1 hypothetical protein [Propioniciclava sp. MC1683]
MTSTASHSTPRTRRRILLVSSLVIGTVASLALMVASSWVPFLDWAAVVVALVAGFLATWAALVEFREWRGKAAAEAAEARAAERTRTHQLHETQRRVLTTVDARIQAIADTLGEARAELDATKEELVGTKVTLGETQQLVSRLRGDNEALRVENTDLHRKLAAATETDAEADVLALPRRRATATSTEWDALEAPTVVDLDLQRLAQPFVAEVQARHAN